MDLQFPRPQRALEPLFNSDETNKHPANIAMKCNELIKSCLVTVFTWLHTFWIYFFESGSRFGLYSAHELRIPQCLTLSRWVQARLRTCIKHDCRDDTFAFQVNFMILNPKSTRSASFLHFLPAGLFKTSLYSGQVGQLWRWIRDQIEIHGAVSLAPGPMFYLLANTW